MAAGQSGRPRTRRAPRRIAVALGAVTAVVPLTSVGPSAAGGLAAVPPTEPPAAPTAAVELLDPGAGEQVELPPVALVGQAVSIETAVTRDISLSGGGTDAAVSSVVRFAVTATVIDVIDGGGYTVRTRIDSLDAEADTDTGDDADDSPLALLVGIEYDRRFGAAGELVDAEVVAGETMSATAAEIADRFVGELDAAVLAFPDEPIAVGARWSVPQEVVSGTITVPVAYTFDLVDVADGRFALDVTFHSEFGDAPPSGAGSLDSVGGGSVVEDTGLDDTFLPPGAAGAISGSGAIVGSLTNPLDVTVTLEQVVTATLDTVAGPVAFEAIVSVEQTAIS